MKDLIQSRILQPLLHLLTQGITPEKIALSLAIGIALGVFPVLGSTTGLCLLAAIVFRLNVPAIQLVNYLVYPLQLALVIPFIRLGERIFRAPPVALSLTQILAMARADLAGTVRGLWLTTLHAAAAWLLVGPLLIALLYFVLAPLLRAMAGAKVSTAVVEPDGLAQ